jgi:hypothetical protein
MASRQAFTTLRPDWANKVTVHAGGCGFFAEASPFGNSPMEGKREDTGDYDQEYE